MTRILAILAATLLALPAAEGSAAGTGQGLHRGQFRQHLLKKFDADKDGKLSEAERAAAKQACKDKFDSDKDGKLSEAERDAARAAFSARLKEKHPELFAKVDKDGDGTISREEGQAARAWLRQHRGQRGTSDAKAD
jgi:hypothetical protein